MIKKICDVSAPSGAEQRMTEYIKNEFHFDDAYTDNTGSLIARRGNGSALCIECGIDTPGIMVTSSEDGEIRFAGFGGISPQILADRKIVFQSGTWGIVRCCGKCDENTKMSDLSAEIEGGDVNIGDFGVLDSEFCETDSKLFSNNLSARLGLIAALSAIQDPRSSSAGFTVAFTAQKRLGARGIRSFFGNSEFEHVLTIDSVSCGKSKKIGDGCAIIAKDKRCVSDPAVRREIEDLAERCGIRHYTAVCDDNLYIENITTAGKGAVCAAICVPVGCKGQNLEYAAKSDIESAAELIKEIIIAWGE